MSVSRPGSAIIPLLFAPILLSLVPGCRGTQVSSAWRAREIAVDGQRADWQEIGVYDLADQGIQVGVAHDDQSLYLLLITPNRMLAMQVLRQGLTARFKPEKGTRAGLWLGCPRAVRMRPDSARGRPEGDGQRPGPPDGMWGQGFGSDERIRQMLMELPEEILIIGSTGEDSLRLPRTDAARLGIEERAGNDEDCFALEMKLPLRKDPDHPLAIGLPPGAGDLVELHLFVPKPDEKTMPRGSLRPDGEGRMPPPGGSDFPRGGERPGGGRSGRGGPRPASFGRVEGLDVKLKIKLSTEPAGGS